MSEHIEKLKALLRTKKWKKITEKVDYGTQNYVDETVFENCKLTDKEWNKFVWSGLTASVDTRGNILHPIFEDEEYIYITANERTGSVIRRFTKNTVGRILSNYQVPEPEHMPTYDELIEQVGWFCQAVDVVGLDHVKTVEQATIMRSTRDAGEAFIEQIGLLKEAEEE